MSTDQSDTALPLRHRPLTRLLPRFAWEAGLTGFFLMAALLLFTSAGTEATRTGALILVGGSTLIGAFAGATLAVCYWWWGRVEYKRSGGPMAPPTDEPE